MSGTTVTLIVPCYNEGPRIVRSLATLVSWFGPDVSILVVDDGSADETAEQAERFSEAHSQVKVHRLVPNRGKGAAVRAAMAVVTTDVAVFTDADLAFDRMSVQRVIDALADADVAVGNRRHDRSSYTVPVRLFGFLYRRHLVGLLFNAFVRAVVPITQRDTQCGLKGFRRSTLEALASSLTIDGFAWDVELLLVARALDARLIEVPVHVHYETARSSVTLLVSARAMVRDVLSIAFRRLRGAYAPAAVRARAEAAKRAGWSSQGGRPAS